MAGDDRPAASPIANAEDRLLRRLRLIAGAVVLACIVLLVVVDTAGKVFFGPDFHTSELFMGTLIGALLLLLGLSVPSWLGGVRR